MQTAVIATNTSLSVDNASPNPPGPITFTLSITNSGQSAATNVVVADMFDSRFSYVSSTNGGVHVSADSVQWVFASIAPGGSASVTLTVNIQTNLAARHRNSKYHEHCIQRWHSAAKQNFKHC